MNLLIREGMEMTPRQFQNYYEGFLDQKISDHHESWHQVRMMAYYAASGNLKKGTKPEDILKFPWDGENVESEQFDDADEPLEEIGEKIRNHWAEIDRKRGGPSSKH